MNENLHKRILHKFGKDCLDAARKYERTQRKIADYRNHLRYSLRCYHSSLTPPSLRLRTSIPGRNANSIIINAERKLLNERIRQINATLDYLKDTSSTHEEFLCENQSGCNNAKSQTATYKHNKRRKVSFENFERKQRHHDIASRQGKLLL